MSDRHEIANGIVRQFLVSRRVDRERTVAAQQRGAVSGRPGDDFSADDCARAGPIVDEHLPPEDLGEALREEIVGAYALSEAGSGSDAFALQTRATLKGSEYL